MDSGGWGWIWVNLELKKSGKWIIFFTKQTMMLCVLVGSNRIEWKQIFLEIIEVEGMIWEKYIYYDRNCVHDK